MGRARCGSHSTIRCALRTGADATASSSDSRAGRFHRLFLGPEGFGDSRRHAQGPDAGRRSGDHALELCGRFSFRRRERQHKPIELGYRSHRRRLAAPRHPACHDCVERGQRIMIFLSQSRNDATVDWTGRSFDFARWWSDLGDLHHKRRSREQYCTGCILLPVLDLRSDERWTIDVRG